MYNLQFTEEQMKVLNDALIQMPYFKIATLIQSINQQIFDSTNSKNKENNHPSEKE